MVCIASAARQSQQNEIVYIRIVPVRLLRFARNDKRFTCLNN